MHHGTAGNTAARQSATAAGLPGRLMMSEPPRVPAICRDKMAVGTTLSEAARINSPKPARMRWHTCAVASGVTSRRDGPVPPVVNTSTHRSSSHKHRSAESIRSTSSGTNTLTGSHSLWIDSESQSTTAGPPRSSYSPRNARSDTVTMPIRIVMHRTVSKDKGPAINRSRAL